MHAHSHANDPEGQLVQHHARLWSANLGGSIAKRAGNKKRTQSVCVLFRSTSASSAQMEPGRIELPSVNRSLSASTCVFHRSFSSPDRRPADRLVRASSD